MAPVWPPWWGTFRYSDVYGLGGILYHLLTARPSFQADSLEIVVSQVLTAEPVSLGMLNPAVPRDLETICLKCLEKEPSRRYATAQALADELGRFLRGEPIVARPASGAEKVWRWCRRKPALATALAAVVIVAGPPPRRRPVGVVVFSPKGNRLAIGGDYGHVLRHGHAGQPTGSRVGSVGLGGRWQSGQQQRKGSGGRTGAVASSAG